MNKLCTQHTAESKQQLKTGGLKITAGRLDLLDTLKHAKKPLSIKEIARQMGRGKVDVVTLYRNVESLKSLDMVKQINLKDKQAYYELSDDRRHHHHLICTNCGKIKDIPQCEINITNKKNILKTEGFSKITDHSLEFFGICNSCAKK